MAQAASETTTDTVVMKFGGSSVADPEKIRHVARRLVEARERGARVVGTISAMGKTTDALLDLGHEAVSFTGSQAGIITDAVYNRAKIREITPVRVLEALDRGRIVLVAGFQGFSRDTMDITTLGRGGTDATAVALAAALGGSCEIFSDVLGVYTADPRIVPDARKLDVVSYEEMLEMSASGAKVLMLRAVELARGHGVPIHARSTFSEEQGTWISDVAGMEAPIVSAVTHSEDEVLFTLRGVPDVPGTAAAIFEAVAAEHVSVDTILQNAVHGSAELSFSVPLEDVNGTRRALATAQETIGPIEIEEITDLGKVSLVGAGMRSHPGVAAHMFRVLANESINLRLISTSPIKISCLVARGEVEQAVRALHAAFLGAADGEA